MGNSGIGVPLPELAAYCREAAAEGAVLLKNEGHMLPIKKDETVSIFGRSQIEYYRSGTGSGGAVNVPYVKNILDGIKENNAFPVNEELVETYKEWLKEHPFDNGGGGWAAEPWHQEEMEITDEIARRAAEKSEKAIFLIGRTAGEDKDYEDTEGSYLLTKREKENLRVVTKYFNEVAVLLNVSNIIDMSWTKDAAYQDHIKAILYIWQGGMEGANAVADLLSGRVTPSGKLTDTIAEKLSDYPAADHFGSKTENMYAEDIYVGYRYFETFAPEKVMYEFGFGLSYTEFSMETVKAESTGNGKDAKIALSIRVKNTGAAAGKEAAQVYVSAPQGQLGKPAKVLCGFAKTKLLAPGEEEVLELTIPVSRFASYDDSGVTGHKSCYVLEEGLYKIYVGNSVRCTEKANVDGKGGYEVSSCIVTEELEEALAPTKEFLRLKTGRQKEDGVFARAYEKAPQQMVDLAERIKSRLPKELPQTGNKGITLQAVAENIKNGSSVEEELDAFVAQFTNEELAVIVRGEELAKKNDEQLTIFRRRNIGFIFQNYNLVPILNIYENIVLPVELDGDTVDKRFLNEIVYLLGLEDKLKKLPNNLSGGQQQRVAIARALITKPAIVLADEPTGSLDSKTSAEVLGLIKRTSAEFKQTVVMITHNNDIARLADRIIRIEDGKIVG